MPPVLEAKQQREGWMQCERLSLQNTLVLFHRLVYKYVHRAAKFNSNFAKHTIRTNHYIPQQASVCLVVAGSLVCPLALTGHWAGSPFRLHR